MKNSKKSRLIDSIDDFTYVNDALDYLEDNVCDPRLSAVLVAIREKLVRGMMEVNAVIHD